ncbi:O-antigen ligase family protein [Pedobacter nutrimenti]|uniref:O-antigen ligase family protein n=1 Tax=Pedobacter nutrimenti TaxID=1241337 RepID=UPI00292FABD2|nr:O-antigen ligase family protein [Pedobacter nutrimenti]
MVSNIITNSRPKETDNWKGNLTLWLFLFLSFGYPIQASIPIFLHIPSTPINATFRGLYLFISIFLIVNSFKRSNKLPKGIKALIFFWILYGIRLIYDVSFRGIKLGDKDALYIYSFAFGSCFFPMLAVILNAKYINLNSIYKKLYSIMALSNLLLLILIVYQNGSLSLNLFTSRISITGGDNESVINTIIIGLYGDLLFVLSVYSLLFLRFKNSLIKLLVIFFGLTGLLNLIAAASRGPLVVMVLIVIYMVYFKYKIVSRRADFLAKTIMISIITIFFVLITGFLDNLTERFTIFSRFEQFGQDLKSGEKEARSYEYSSAWDQFCDSPIFGDRFTTRLDSTYPHNIYLEVLMSLGIVGMALLLFLHWEVFRRIKYIFKKKDYIFFLLLIILLIIFLSSMTSGGIGFNPGLWLIFALFLSVKYKNVKYGH